MDANTLLKRGVPTRSPMDSGNEQKREARGAQDNAQRARKRPQRRDGERSRKRQNKRVEKAKQDTHIHTHTHIHMLRTPRWTESLIESAQLSRSGMLDQSVIVETLALPHPAYLTLPCPAPPSVQESRHGTMSEWFLVSYWTEPSISERLPCSPDERRATSPVAVSQ